MLRTLLKTGWKSQEPSVWEVINCFFFISISEFGNCIVGRGLLTSQLYEDFPILLTPPFCKFFQPHPASLLLLLLFLLPSFSAWISNFATSNVLFFLMIWHTYTCWTLVLQYQKDLAMCFMHQGIKFTVGLTLMTWLLVAFWFDVTHTNKYTHNTHRDQKRHINVYLHHLLCAHSSYLYYIELITPWYQKLLLRWSTISLLFKNCSFQKSRICYLDSIRLSPYTKPFLWNTKNTDRNCVNELRKPTPHKKRKMTLERIN